MEENNIKAVKSNKNVRFNILDLIIIVGILFIITALVIMALPKFSNIVESGQKVMISYTLVFEAVDENSFDKIVIGDPLTDTKDGKALGKVSDTPKIEPYYTYVKGSSEGDIVTAEKKEDYQGRSNITITVESEATYSEGKGYTVNGYRIAVGKEIGVRFPNYTNVGTCIGINVVSEG